MVDMNPLFRKLEEKASLYEQLMRSAAEGGDDDAVGGGRLVNFGNKVKQMEIWQDEEAERYCRGGNFGGHQP